MKVSVKSKPVFLIDISSMFQQIFKVSCKNRLKIKLKDFQNG